MIDMGNISVTSGLNKNESGISHIEYSTVIILCCTILIIASPYIYKIFYNMSKSAAETSTAGTVEYVKSIYTRTNLTKDVGLPFKVTFNKNSYTAYDNGEKISLPVINDLTLEGKKPEGGSVIINPDGKISVKNLDFGWRKCNKPKDGDITCE